MEDNKLIAEFMEYPTSSEYWKDGRWEGEDYKDYYYVDGKYDECWGSSNFHVDDMAFGLSWDWLMPVIHNCTKIIENYGYDSDERDYIEDEIFNLDNTLSEFLNNDIESVCARVVEFIKWYNQNK